MGEIADGLLAADDGAVRAALGQELMRVKGAAGPAAALGIPQDASAADVRARFLAVVKLYHPNRFARRPADIVKLANEVFLLLRRAYQRLAEPPTGAPAAAPASAPAGTQAAAQAAAVVAARANEISPPSQPKLDVDAALARRRRLRPGPSTPTTGAPAAIEMLGRARRRDEEQKERYQTALADIGKGNLQDARSALRTLVAESPSDRRYRAYLHYVTGRMHETAGREQEAVVEYDRALGFDREFEPARDARDLLTTRSRGEPEGGGGAGRIGRWFRK